VSAPCPQTGQGGSDRRLDARYTASGRAFEIGAAKRRISPREIAEAALAHVTGDKAERAYRRGDALEKRRALMAEWAVFLLAR
jgi:hypothetical protein